MIYLDAKILSSVMVACNSENRKCKHIIDTHDFTCLLDKLKFTWLNQKQKRSPSESLISGGVPNHRLEKGLWGNHCVCSFFPPSIFICVEIRLI